MRWKRGALVVIAITAALAAGLARELVGRAQPPGDRSRFVFLVIESFDAQYLGDTAGHIGRGGGLGHHAPNLALGDPVYRDKIKVGKVSHLIWTESKESLQVEFDPEPSVRIQVGDPVWIPLGGEARTTRR